MTRGIIVNFQQHLIANCKCYSRLSILNFLTEIKEQPKQAIRPDLFIAIVNLNSQVRTYKNILRLIQSPDSYYKA